MPRRKLIVYHECAMACPKCWGSGEGWYEGNNCTECRGTGEAWSLGEVETEFELSWTRDDLSDLEMLDGYLICPECDQKLFDYAKEELQRELTNAQTKV